MNKYIFYSNGIEDFKNKFFRFIEQYPWLEIQSIDLNRPLIQDQSTRKIQVMASITFN